MTDVSDPASTMPTVMTVSALLANYDRPSVQPTEPWPATGLHELDARTGGLWPGTLWAVVGPAHAGRTVFATQLARLAAVGGLATRLVACHEDATTLLHNLLAAQAKVSLHHLNIGHLTGPDADRLVTARTVLSASPLLISAAGRDADVPTLDAVLADPPAHVLVVDDLDLWSDAHITAVLRRLRSYARQTHTAVVVTVPDAALGDPAPHVASWARLPDRLLRLRRPELLAGSPPHTDTVEVQLCDQTGHPRIRLPAAFQGHFARIVDLPDRKRGDQIEAPHRPEPVSIPADK